MKSCRTCLRCWRPGLILISKPLVITAVFSSLSMMYITPWFLRCLFRLLSIMSFFIIATIFIMFLSFLPSTKESPEEHRHVSREFISERVAQENDRMRQEDFFFGN
ncbi:hypothetical protein GGS20DRAFT_307770 [Poronia punctata]|nr:hypothetical protein GGS20DRAFT_307770 [Poronia punctata]